jgi:hypothetical protein
VRVALPLSSVCPTPLVGCGASGIPVGSRGGAGNVGEATEAEVAADAVDRGVGFKDAADADRVADKLPFDPGVAVVIV